MVHSKIRVSQNLYEISQVSQSRFLCKVVSDYRFRSCILKGKKSLRLGKKNASLAVTLSVAFTIRHPINNKTSFPTALFVSFF